jgi:plasmid stabilization system protein ParE
VNYTVEWTEDAESDLAALWLAAIDRAAFNAAANWLDARLARDPLRLGQPWASSVHRIVVRDSIGVEFEVIEDDKRVLVHGVFVAN